MLALVPTVVATAGISAGIVEIMAATVGTSVVATDIRVEVIIDTSVVIGVTTVVLVVIGVTTAVLVVIGVTTAVLVVIDIVLGIITIIIRVVMAIHMHLATLIVLIHLIDPGIIRPVPTQTIRLLLATLV